MIKEINKANWSGDKAKISINKSKKTVSIYSGKETFKVKKVAKDVYEAWSKSWPDHPFCTIYKFDNEFSASSGNCSRESECIYEAIAKLAFNLI